MGVRRGFEEVVPFDFEVGEEVANGEGKGGAKEELGDEWHAEVGIAGPWPGKADRGYTAESCEVEESEGGYVDAEGNERGGDSRLLPSGQEAVHDCPLQELNDALGYVEATIDEPSLLGDLSAAPVAAQSKVKTAARFERKLRRQLLGTYRPESQTRQKEKTSEGAYQSALEKIEAMPGAKINKQKLDPPKPPKENSKAHAAKSKDHQPSNPKTTTTNPPTPPPQPKPPKLPWQIQKAALTAKFPSQPWQPRKRLSPDTLNGLRALHASDPTAYSTATLAEHFKVTPEAIRRILKSKWRPSAEEVEERKGRWERRGERKWGEMARLGMRPPGRWRAKGILDGGSVGKRDGRRGREGPGAREEYVPWGESVAV